MPNYTELKFGITSRDGSRGADDGIDRGSLSICKQSACLWGDIRLETVTGKYLLLGIYGHRDRLLRW